METGWRGPRRKWPVLFDYILELIKAAIMNIAESILRAWSGSVVEKYTRKSRPEHLQPSLFEHELQPKLDGLGPGRWITIGSEKDPDGARHGGHHVFVGPDGKMKTGAHAGQTMDEAFGNKSRPTRSDMPENRKSGIVPKVPAALTSDEQSDIDELDSYLHGPYFKARESGMKHEDALSHVRSGRWRKSGIVPGSTSVKNEDAKEGDQLGLFGEGDKAKPAPWKPTLLDSRGKQSSLFDSKGDKDQKLLFDDGVTPSDMVLQSDDIPSDKAVSAREQAIEAGKTPREASQAAQKKLDEDYEFARASSVGNAGEDLKGAARHKINAWKGLEAAEKDGTAEAMVTRDQLAKIEPHNLMVHADKNPFTSLAMHFAMRAFPAKPGTGKGGDHKKDREQYLQTYRSIKAKAEELAASGDDKDPIGAVTKLNQFVRAKIDELRGSKGRDAISQSTMTDRFNQTANDLVGMHKALITGYRANKTCVVGRLNEFSSAVQEKYGTTFTDLSKSGSLAEKREAVNLASSHAKDVIEGHSLNKTFGKESKKTNRFDPAEMYVKIATRNGGRDLAKVTDDPNKATKHMVEAMGLRGVQWGNSVTDDERKHHAARAVEALTDLADTLGLHPKDIALDGKLGLAIGARGRGGAVAHYEPSTTVINLTRASGVGSLAHEWAHAFDHALNDHDGAKFMSEDTDTHETEQEYGRGNDKRIYRSTTSNPERMQQMGRTVKERPKSAIRGSLTALRASQANYRARLQDELDRDIKSGWMTVKQANTYWKSEKEIFARTAERYIQHKLESSGKKNTYLAGIETKGHKAGGYWPTDEEVEAMAPAFDKVFEEYRKHKYGSAEKVMFSKKEAWVNFQPLLIEQYSKAFDESRVFRTPAGSHGGGQFTKSPVRIETSVLDKYPGDRHKQAKAWAMDHVRDKTVKNRSTGWEITVDKTGIKEATQKKMPSPLAIIGILNILEHAELVQTDPPKQIDNNLIQSHLFAHRNVMIDGIEHEAMVRVKEFVLTGKRFYSIHAIQKKGSSLDPAASESQTKQELDEPSATSIDEPWEEIKKGNDYYANDWASMVDRYWNTFRSDDLFLSPDISVVDRYEWNAAAHPRHPAGSPNSVGGEFSGKGGNRPGGSVSPRLIESGMSPNSTRWADVWNSKAKASEPIAESKRTSVKRELAHTPKIDGSHALHFSNLDKKDSQRVLDWHYRVHEALRPMDKMPTNPKSAEEQDEDGWTKVDKSKLRELLDEMNSMDREFRSRGIRLSDYVNASQLIPRKLAVRLDGGERFFNPEKLGNKLRDGRGKGGQQSSRVDLTDFHNGDREGRKRLLQNESMRDAIAKAMGLTSGGTVAPKAEKKQIGRDQPQVEHKPKSIPTGLSKQAENKLDGIVSEVVGDGDQAKKEHFRQVALDAWKQMKSLAEEHNGALRQITSFFGKHHGALAANIAKGLDPTRLRGFDELVDHAAREFPQIVSQFRGESDTGTAEEGLVKALREGIRDVPQPWDDAVIDRAMQMVGPAFFEEHIADSSNADNWDSIPFSVRSEVRRWVQRYWIKAVPERYAVRSHPMHAAKPTDAQKEAGNYRMAHINLHGLEITIETPRGRSRREGWPKMSCHYGYVKGTLGRDGDHVDVFVGPDRTSELVYVIDQPNAKGGFDEHKCLLGFRSKEAAIAAYRDCYTIGWIVGRVTAMTIDQFKAWLSAGDQTKPIAGQVARYSLATAIGT